MFVIEQLEFDENVIAELGKTGTSVLAAAENEAILVVASLHSVERLLQRVERVLLVVHLLHF